LFHKNKIITVYRAAQDVYWHRFQNFQWVIFTVFADVTWDPFLIAETGSVTITALIFWKSGKKNRKWVSHDFV
jgi:hypothetical protein